MSQATYYNGSVSKPGALVQCQAEKKSGSRGQCKNKAVIGQSVCKYHGGLSTGRPRVIGKYGRYADQSLHEKLNELYSDEDYRDLKDELILLRGLIANELEVAQRREATKTKAKGEIKAYKIIELTKEIRQVIDTIERIENEKQYMLSVKSVERLMYQWISILSKHIQDAAILVAIQREISGTVIDGNTGKRVDAGDRTEAVAVNSTKGFKRSGVLLPGNPGL